MSLKDIKVDNRGTIYKFKTNSKKFLIIHTDAESLRAGEIHNIEQYTFLIDGRVEVITKEYNKDMHRFYSSGAKIVIPAGTPHYFKFLEESIMVEMENENMKTEYYPEYRKLVEESLK